MVDCNIPPSTDNPSDLEKQGWEWLDSMVSSLCDEEPSDIAYSADQMVDAFIAGASHRQASIAQQAEVQRLDLDSVHTCHDQCQRLPCVQQREIARLREALKGAKDALDSIPAPHSFPLWQRMCAAIRKAEAALNDQPGGEG